MERLWANTALLQDADEGSWASICGQSSHAHHPGDARRGDAGPPFSRRLFEEGVFAMAIGFPTVPRGMARIRVMNTAAHTKDDLDRGLEVFAKVGKELGVI